MKKNTELKSPNHTRVLVVREGSGGEQRFESVCGEGGVLGGSHLRQGHEPKLSLCHDKENLSILSLAFKIWGMKWAGVEFQKQFWSGYVGFGGHHQDFGLVFMWEVRAKGERYHALHKNIYGCTGEWSLSVYLSLCHILWNMPLMSTLVDGLHTCQALPLPTPLPSFHWSHFGAV